MLGRPIGHSLSPRLHRAAYAALGLDWTYDAVDCGEADLPAEGSYHTLGGLILALLRRVLRRRILQPAEELQHAPNGGLVRHCGIVTLRQQPETAHGVVFVSLEDETGVVQVIVWKALRERQRAALTRSRLLAVYGTWQREGEVRNLIAGHLEDLTPLLGRLAAGRSRDFH